MTLLYPGEFLGLPPRPIDEADALLLPIPLERTVSYGTGTWRAPRAIIDASSQLESFDEETLVDFTQAPKLHTLPALVDDGNVTDYLAVISQYVAQFRDRFLLTLGGEHTITYGVLMGLAAAADDVTIVQIDAHGDLADSLGGRHWSHGTVMRRLWDQGCRLVQVGIRSVSRPEFELAAKGDRITTFYAYQLAQRWQEMLEVIDGLEGPVYLTVDVDGLDPAVIPSTGTPQPDGLSWRQTMDILRAVTGNTRCDLIGADVVEFIASPHPPGCDILAARLVMKLLAYWHAGRQK